MFVSPPVADSDGPFVVAAFATVISLTAEPAAETLNSSFAFVSLIDVPILGVFKVPLLIVGLVNVLFVSVSVVAKPTRVSLAFGKLIVLFAVGVVALSDTV